jgi:hypothetical protein
LTFGNTSILLLMTVRKLAGVLKSAIICVTGMNCVQAAGVGSALRPTVDAFGCARGTSDDWRVIQVRLSL